MNAQPHQITRQNPVHLFLFALVFVMIGGGTLFFWGIPTIQKAYESVHWPSVQGAIIVSHFSSDSDSDGTTYKADIGYDYSINGQNLSGSTVSFGAPNSSNASEIRAIVNHYPLGALVPVYYNPDDPSISVLEPGINWSIFFIAGIGALFLLVGLIMAVQALKGKPKGNAKGQQEPTQPVGSIS